MWRVVSSSSRRRIFRCSAFSTAASTSGGGRLGKMLLVTVGGSVVAGGALYAYAYQNPEFLSDLETRFPQLKLFIDSYVGDAMLRNSQARTKQSISSRAEHQVVTRIQEKLPKETDELLLTSRSLPSSSSSPSTSSSRPPVNIDAVDIRKNGIPAPKVSKDEDARLNREFEERLKAAIASAENRVKVVTEAKVATIEAIREHSKLLKSTVDAGASADWQTVTNSLQRSEQLAHKDHQLEVDSKNYLDSVYKLVNDGRKEAATANNALLANAHETANKLSRQVAEVNQLVQKARVESRVLNEYRELVEKSREQFALEMKAILPSIDTHAKEKRLTEDELNALIVHAHLRVDQLRRQLIEQQLREEQNIARAIEEQRKADERLAAEGLALELQRRTEQKDVEMTRELAESRRQWEAELEERLKRAAVAHSEHLEQVIRTQRQLFDIEHAQKLDEVIAKEREVQIRQVGEVTSRLNGIEDVLHSKVAQDVENRRSKLLWIACQNLADSVVYGSKAGSDADTRRLPLKEAVNAIAQVTSEDEFAKALIANFPEDALESGAYTEEDLKNRFYKVYKVGRRMAWIEESGGSLLRYLTSYARSLVFFDVPFDPNQEFNPHSLSNAEILARAKFFVEQDDFVSALKMMLWLRGEPARVATDWECDARMHLETLLMARLLLAHAAATSLRTTY